MLGHLNNDYDDYGVTYNKILSMEGRNTFWGGPHIYIFRFRGTEHVKGWEPLV